MIIMSHIQNACMINVYKSQESSALGVLYYYTGAQALLFPSLFNNACAGNDEVQNSKESICGQDSQNFGFRKLFHRSRLNRNFLLAQLIILQHWFFKITAIFYMKQYIYKAVEFRLILYAIFCYVIMYFQNIALVLGKNWLTSWTNSGTLIGTSKFPSVCTSNVRCSLPIYNFLFECSVYSII